MTGVELCQWASARYRCGEAIFAYIGRAHVVAVLPFEERGIVRYKIVDSWDCTCKRITAFFVKDTQTDDNKEVPTTVFSAGAKFKHPAFGEGVIEEVSPHGWLVVAFDDGTRKNIDAKWASTNCMKATQVLPML